MVRSIHHWCQVAGLIELGGMDLNNRRRFVPTELGDSIFADDGFDPYLEDAATLWLIHWNLTTNANRATTWFWAFSIFGQNEFTKDKFISELIDWAEKSTRNRISENSIKRDVDCFLRTYVPSRLTKTTTDGRYLRLSTRRIEPDFRFARRKHLPISSRSETLPADRDFRRCPF